ncbi:MAG TPA: hypothetical protein VIL46_08645, partial [Gemmataceae bacterium]
VILPLFHGRPLSYAQVMRSAISLNGSFFNAQRMVAQYLNNAYLPAYRDVPHAPGETALLFPTAAGGMR